MVMGEDHSPMDTDELVGIVAPPSENTGPCPSCGVDAQAWKKEQEALNSQIVNLNYNQALTRFEKSKTVFVLRHHYEYGGHDGWPVEGVYATRELAEAQRLKLYGTEGRAEVQAFEVKTL